jgi:hypothetical protein
MYKAWLNSDNAGIAAQIKPQNGLVSLLNASSPANIEDTIYQELFPRPGAGYKNYVESGLITNEGTGCWVKIVEDTAAATVLFVGYAASGAGFIIPPGVFTTLADNTAIGIICESAGKVRCTLTGYKGLG